MIVRDEAQQLPGCLASLDPGVSEIVVVDTGSRDATAELARAAGARLIEVPWREDFAAARNVALEAARSDFCLMLDADEQVEAESWTSLWAFLGAGGHDFGRINIVSESPEGTVRESITRVCRNDGRARYEGRIHEQLVGPGSRGDTGLVCRHSGYLPEVVAERGKLERNARLLRRALEDAPHDAYLHHQLGRTLARCGAESEAEALEHLHRAVAQAPRDAAYLPAAVRDLGYRLHETGRDREGLALVRRFRPLHPGFTDLVFLEGVLCLALGDRDGMLRAFEGCLRLGEPQGYTSVEGVGSYRAHHNLGLYKELSGQRQAACAHYRAALAAAPDFAPSRERLEALEAGRPRQAPAGGRPRLRG